MTARIATWLKISAGLLLGVSALSAQDSSALIGSLVKNGVITQDQAQLILKDLAKVPPAPAAPTNAEVDTLRGKYLKRLQLYGFLQEQFYNGATSVDGAAYNPNFYSNRFFVRRAYFGLKAQLAEGWSGTIFYDFAASFFEQAFIEWKHSDLLAIDVGVRKVPFAFDETTSSRDLRAIERSAVTSYFVNANNNRRLGAGSIHVGLFAFGTKGDFSYTVAISNPERGEFAGGGGTPTVFDQRTTAKGNGFTYWARGAYGHKLKNGTWQVGVEGGYLPEQGGNTTAKTNGSITEWGTYVDATLGGFNLQAEYMAASVNHGAVNGARAKPAGFWIQPSYRVGNLEGTLRYSTLDSDHRGVDISDGIRAAPGGGTMNKLNEWYAGGSWYILGNDVKLQAGYIHAETRDTVAGAPAKAKSDGIRSQLLLNF
jgi:phosphate-selective porin